MQFGYCEHINAKFGSCQKAKAKIPIDLRAAGFHPTPEHRPSITRTRKWIPQ